MAFCALWYLRVILLPNLVVEVYQVVLPLEVSHDTLALSVAVSQRAISAMVKQPVLEEAPF
jgi:hypothetical protein